MVFTCCGINFAFGVFQDFYEILSREPDTPFTGSTPAEIAIIGTVSVSLMTIGAPFTVAWAKRFSPRYVSFVGSFVFSAALILASFGTTLWHFQLSQGLLLGIGTCLSYMVAVTIAPTWFGARRGLALGVITAGTGIGGLVWAPALKACIDGLGYRNALRIASGVSFVLNMTAGGAIIWEHGTEARLRLEQSTQTSRAKGLFQVPLIEWRIAKTRKFAAQAIGAMFQSAAYYLPLFFFATYARSLGYSNTAGANFIALSNACNAIGKIAIGHAADRLGRLNALVLTTIISAIITLSCWVPSTYLGDTAVSCNLFIAFTVLYGIFASAYIALFPTSLVELFGTENFASVNGVLYMVRGIATLIGTPIGSAMVLSSGDKTPRPGDYTGMAILTGGLLIAASFAVIWVRLEALVKPDGKIAWKWRL